IRVRVHPSFWFFGALLGWTWGQRIQQFGLTDLLVWMGCYFFSVLVHELGHVIMGILCGQHGYIVLHFFGGMAIGQYQLARRWQRIAISLAGPAAGFFLYGLVVLFKYHLLHQIDPIAQNKHLSRGMEML